MNKQLIKIEASKQIMYCYEDEHELMQYPVSTGKNGMGELSGSECTPRGWHAIYSKIGLNNVVNSVNGQVRYIVKI